MNVSRLSLRLGFVLSGFFCLSIGIGTVLFAEPGNAGNALADSTVADAGSTETDAESDLETAPSPKPQFASESSDLEGAIDGATAAAAAPKCDAKKCAALNKAAASSHAPVFYNNKFDYLCDDCWCGDLLGDSLKRRGNCDWLVYDIGGQYRARYHNEHNHRGLGLTGLDDQFLLHRTRLYGNFEIGEHFRVFVEGIDAESSYENFAPRTIEVNRSDIQNLFADLKLHENCSGELWARVGRQELLYGAQRLVSPPDWANTRRTWEGYKLMWKGQDWDADAFWTRPIFPDPHNFDSPDHSQEFMGVYTTYKAVKDNTVDLYYLRYVETDAVPFEFDTIGARWQTKQDQWLGEVEAAYQGGDVNNVTHSAGFFTLGLGREFPCTTWKPTLWAYYDWASGDDPVGATGNGFHPLFPLGHKYLGWMDLYGRRNIEDLNFLLTAQPREKLKLTAWWHIFHLQDGDDVPYNVSNGRSATIPGGSQYLGQELDLLATWTFNPRASLSLGYSHFWTGSFYTTNPTPGLFAGDADFFYTDFTVNF